MTIFVQQLVNGMVLGSAYLLVGMGLYIVFNALHIPNFAHGEMFALGSYLQYTFVVGLGLAFWPGLVMVVGCVFVVGAAMALAVFERLRGMATTALLLASIALSIVLQEVLAVVWGRDALAVTPPVDTVIRLGELAVSAYRLILVLVAGTVAILVALVVYRTTFGRRLRAIAQNDQLAALSGIRSRRVAVVAFALGSCLAGLAGALLAPALSINPHMGLAQTLVAFVILVVVGAGAKLSTVVATALGLALLETMVAGYVSNTLRLTVVFAVLIAFLTLRPNGVSRTAVSVRGAL